MRHIDLDNPPDEAGVYAEMYLREQAKCRELEGRRDELLALVAKLSQTVPLESEVAEALNQHGVLLAEIGTLRAKIRELEETNIESHPTSKTELLHWPAPEEPPEHCEHNYLTASILNGEIIGQNCMNCWLPVGVPCQPVPATDDARTAIEIAAANEALRWDEGFGISPGDCAVGWNSRLYYNEAENRLTVELGDGQASRDWEAGWLAACICDE